jgi:hypothetical protein
MRLAKIATIAKACDAEVKKSCAGIKRGQGRIEACVKSALSNLSDACKVAIVHAAVGTR